MTNTHTEYAVQVVVLKFTVDDDNPNNWLDYDVVRADTIKITHEESARQFASTLASLPSIVLSALACQAGVGKVPCGACKDTIEWWMDGGYCHET